LRNIDEAPESTSLFKPDAEFGNTGVPLYRAMQLVFHLTLRLVPDKRQAGPSVVCVKEESVTWRAFVSILCSELSTIVAAVIAGMLFKCWWLIPYFCVPLILKFLAVLLVFAGTD